MRKQACMAIFFLSMTSAVSLSADQKETDNLAQASQKGMNSQAQTPDECASLSSKEKQFVQKLSVSNMKMFCQRFNAGQRSTAMKMTGQTDSSGNVISADQAVQKVAQDNNMMPMQQKGGSCPVK